MKVLPNLLHTCQVELHKAGERKKHKPIKRSEISTMDLVQTLSNPLSKKSPTPCGGQEMIGIRCSFCFTSPATQLLASDTRLIKCFVSSLFHGARLLCLSTRFLLLLRLWGKHPTLYCGKQTKKSPFFSFQIKVSRGQQ